MAKDLLLSAIVQELTSGTRLSGEEVDVTVDLEFVGEEAPVIASGVGRVEARTELGADCS